MKNKLKQYPNIILGIISVIAFLITLLAYPISYYIWKFGGHFPYLIDTLWVMGVPVVFFVILFVPTLGDQKIGLYSITIFIIYISLLLYIGVPAYEDIIEHCNYMALQRDEQRYDIEKITLDELQNIEKGNHIIYIGRTDSVEHNSIYDFLYNETLKRPLKILYYDVSEDIENNNEKMTDTLSKFEVLEMPAVVFIVNGEKKEVLLYYDIIQSFIEVVMKYHEAYAEYFI